MSEGLPREEDTTEVRNFAYGGMLADGRICAFFLPGAASSSPTWQFDLVLKDLARDVPAMAIEYVDFGQEKFNPDVIVNKVVEEIRRGDYIRYLVVGMGLGGQLAYSVLTRLDERMAGRTTGVLFSTPISGATIRGGSAGIAKWIFKREKLGKFLDKFRKFYWQAFEERKNLDKYPDDVIEAYVRRRAYTRMFPVDTYFAQQYYFYGFKADRGIRSRLVVINAVGDKSIKNTGEWDKLTADIDHRKMVGDRADSVIDHAEFARIIVDETEREGRLLKSIMENFGGVV